MAVNNSCASTPEETEKAFFDAISEDQLIIDELLASGVHAINTGKLTVDITPSFSLFYDDKAVKAAHEKLKNYISSRPDLKNIKLSTKSRKVDKNEAKSTDLTNIIDALRSIDWTGRILPFVVADISQICKVYGGLRDEIQLRDEVSQMKTRLENLEKILPNLRDVSTKVDTIVNNIKHLENNENKQATSKPLFREIVITTGQKENTNRKNQRKPQTDTKQPPPHSHSQDEVRLTPPSPSWKVVTTRKRPKKHPLVGMEESDQLKSSEIRPIKLFVTRCHADTTGDSMQQYLENKRQWSVLAVEQVKTRFNTYSSWKVILNKCDLARSEIMKPENWPKGVMVSPFFVKRNVGTFNRENSVKTQF